MQTSSNIICTPQALTKSVHTCASEGCRSVNYYRQAKRVNIIPILESNFIRHFQALFIISSKSNSRTKLISYYMRITYILLKTGGVGVFKDANGNPMFGELENVRCNFIGDIISYDIVPFNFGYSDYRHHFFRYSEFSHYPNFALVLPARKGIKSQYFVLFDDLNDGFDNKRINQDNNMIKYFYDAGTINQGDKVNIRMTPSVDNMGIAVTYRERIPSDLRNDESKKDNGSGVIKALTEGEGLGLIPNKYQNDTQMAWYNFEKGFKFLCLMVGVRENKDSKGANQTHAEVQNNNFSFDLAENYMLNTIQELVYNWNEAFNEDNMVEKTVTIDYSNNNNNGGLDDVLL